jgi:hypothetical protein
MIPEIIHANVPEKYLQNVPKVHKLTLEKENEKSRETGKKGDDGMDIDKERRRRKYKNPKGKDMLVDESSTAQGHDEEEME